MQLKFPKPSDSTGLENLTVMLVEHQYGTGNVHRVGRSGQSQNGVDVHAATWSNHLGHHFVGYQSKCVKALSLAEVKAECAKAKNYKPRIEKLVVVASIPRDAQLQSQINSIPRSTYGFAVDIWFWDDVDEKLNRSADKAREFYSKIMSEAQPAAAKNQAEALKRALDRPAFRDVVDMDRDLGELVEAFANTLGFLRTGILYDNRKNLVESVPPPWKIDEPWYQTFLTDFTNSMQKLYDFTLKNKSFLMSPGTNPGNIACNQFMAKRNTLVGKANGAFRKLDIQELIIPPLMPVQSGMPAAHP